VGQGCPMFAPGCGLRDLDDGRLRGAGRAAAGGDIARVGRAQVPGGLRPAIGPGQGTSRDPRGAGSVAGEGGPICRAATGCRRLGSPGRQRRPVADQGPPDRHRRRLGWREYDAQDGSKRQGKTACRGRRTLTRLRRGRTRMESRESCNLAEEARAISFATLSRRCRSRREPTAPRHAAYRRGESPG
jgi:hypothetical protein